jgi:hypothetical protein
MSDLSQEIAKRGRPKAIKKGRTSWTPASLNEFSDKEDGYRYRMVRKDPENLAKKTQEGWETVSKLNANTKHDDPGRIEDGQNLTSVQEGRDWVLMRMTEEVAKERDAFWNNESARRVSGLTAHVKKEIGKTGGEAHGDITISSRSGTQVIT